MSRRLIVTADDFGMSLEVNEAVEEAHRKGVLTCTSLLVAGDAAADAFARARRMPGLGVGLHLALYGAPAAAEAQSVQDLLDTQGTDLGERPAQTGARIALSVRLRRQVKSEIAAQFRGFAREGVALDHLDGHWHCHQHPTILNIALKEGAAYRLRAVRVPFETPWHGWRAAGRRRLGPRVTDAVGHWPLAVLMRRRLRRAGITANDAFFGKHDGGSIDITWLTRLVRRLPKGVSEIGLHPSSTPWSGRHAPPAHWRTRAELDALLDPAFRDTCRSAGVTFVRFADLSG